jgi:hypothetical protein
MGQILRYKARQLVSNDLTTDTPWGYDEPEILRYSNRQFGPIGADAGQAELERVRQAVPVSGGEETPGGWKNYPGMQWGQKGPASFAWFLQLVASHHYSR